MFLLSGGYTIQLLQVTVLGVERILDLSHRQSRKKGATKGSRLCLKPATALKKIASGRPDRTANGGEKILTTNPQLSDASPRVRARLIRPLRTPPLVPRSFAAAENTRGNKPGALAWA